MAAFWSAFFGGQLVDRALVERMTTPVTVIPDDRRLGLGIWLRESGSAVFLEAYDAGVSCRSVHDPKQGLTHTVLANTSSRRPARHGRAVGRLRAVNRTVRGRCRAIS